MFESQNLHGTAQQSFTPRSRFKAWLHRHRKIVITIVVVAVLAIGGGVYAWTQRSTAPVANTPTPSEQPAPPPPPPPKFYSPLTGAETTEALAKRPVTGVMIENSPSARPQSGLWDAGVVFEAIAEGGITRLAVLYQEKAPSLVGPVRSLRMYYLDWMAAFDASIVHIGGSSKALQTVRNGSFRDADQFFNAGSFWRATDRSAPHNVYTSFEKLDELNKNKGFTSSKFTAFPRRDEVKGQTVTAGKVEVNISSALYNSRYAYEPGENCYKRSHQSGNEHLDREQKKALCPKVVAVMKVQETTVLEDGYRQSIATDGSGQAYVFQDGHVKVGTWSKAGQKDQIVFKDENGVVIDFVRGQTWITAIPNTKSVTWTP